jgi:diguanylate cyclase (GGDEF)-like protein
MAQEVLIIDDDPAIHRLVAAHLASWRTELCSALDGDAGVAMAVERKPDLVLLDVDMPGMNGHEVCRRLKSNPETRDIPVLFLTGAGSTNQKVLGLDMGAMDYITKPFDPFELRARASSALRTKRLIDLLNSKAMIDELTGLYNRAFFERHLHAELARARRSALPLACVLVEVDRFDQIVREFGCAAGEDVLSHVASDLEQTCRREDVVCRYGEERFAILGANKESHRVVDVAERLRGRLCAAPVICGTAATSVTASFGIATSHASVGCSIVSDAEEALDRAKMAGGNRVEISGTWPQWQLANSSQKLCESL